MYLNKSEKKYKFFRFTNFFLMFLGYTFFYFTRKSLIFISPLIINDLSISLNQFGILNTLFYLIYAISKLFAGIISDKKKSKYILFLGLVSTGFINMCISIFSYNITLILLFWMFNAFFQSLGWPPITKQLTLFYNRKERGFWWSLCSLSHNIGAAFIPLILNLLLLFFNWRFSIFLIGFFSILMGFFILYFFFEPDFYDISNKVLTSNSFIYVFYNSNIWLLSFIYIFVYIIRTAISDWLILFLVNQKKYDLVSAGFGIFYFEIFGILGILFAGWFTDIVFNGKRIIYVIMASFFLIFISFFFYIIPIGYIYIDYIMLSFLGFFIFGLQMLVGLFSSEIVNKDFSCTANGFVGTWAYFGAAITGYPFGLIINFSWNIYFFIICFISFMLFVFSLLIFWKKIL